jgi:hypothetical protein
MREPLLFVVCLLGLTGCAGGHAFDGDPLTGGPPLPRDGGAPAPGGALANNSQPGAAQGPLPPLPTPSGTLSPAALAGGNVAPLDTRGNIRIADTSAPTPSPTSDTGGWRGPGTAASVTLRTPEPTADPGTRGSTPSVIVPPPVVAPTVTPVGLAAGRGEYEQLQDMLAKRGVNWQRLETWGTSGEWKFTCMIPNPQNPANHTMYEATAAGRNGMAAVQAVIEQIDRAHR